MFSHFRNKAFLPISYNRNDLPIPHSMYPWKPATHMGMSSVLVCLISYVDICRDNHVLD